MNVIRFTDPRETEYWNVGDHWPCPGNGSDEIVTRVDREHGEVHFRRATWWRRAWYWVRRLPGRIWFPARNRVSWWLYVARCRWQGVDP